MVTRLELVVDRLDQSLARRKRELFDIQLLAAGSAGAKANSLRRAGHVLAYAHWEGFAKICLKSYLQYVCDSSVKIKDLKQPFRASMVAMRLHGQLPTDRHSLAADVVSFLENEQECFFKIDSDAVVKTGNLDSSKFKTLLDLCSLEYLDYYATRENFIDSILCGRRHRIAHGGSEPVEKKDFAPVVEGVLELCETLSDQVVEGLLEEYFMYNGIATLPLSIIQ